MEYGISVTEACSLLLEVKGIGGHSDLTEVESFSGVPAGFTRCLASFVTLVEYCLQKSQ